MTAYQFSQPWLSLRGNPAEASSASEWAHLRTYLQGLDSGSISLFNPNFLNATIGNLTITTSTTITGNVTVTGTLTFSPTTNGIVGTTTNDNATAGLVGEYKESVITMTTNFPATTTYGDATSLSLTAGDWDVTAFMVVNINGASIQSTQIGISQTIGNSATGLIQGSNYCIDIPPSSASNAAMFVPSYRQSLSATTQVYLKMRANYTSGTPQFTGCRLSARRIR